jgi:hypothetical protein
VHASWSRVTESRLNKTILPPQEFHRIQTSLHEQGHHHPQGSESRWLISVWATRCLRLDVSFWTRCHFRLGPVLLPGSGAATFLSNKDGRALGTAGQNLFSLRVASCWTGLRVWCIINERNNSGLGASGTIWISFICQDCCHRASLGLVNTKTEKIFSSSLF